MGTSNADTFAIVFFLTAMKDIRLEREWPI